MSKYLVVRRQLNGMMYLVDPFGSEPQRCSYVHAEPTDPPSIGFCKSGSMIIQNLIFNICYRDKLSNCKSGSMIIRNLTFNICYRDKLSNDIRTTEMPGNLAPVEDYFL